MPEYLQYGLNAIILLAVAVLVNILAKRVLVQAICALASKTKANWDDILAEHKVFHRMSHLAPGLVIYFGCIVLFPEAVAEPIQRVAMAYMTIMLLLSITTFLTAMVDVYRTLDVAKDRPIKGIIQSIEIIIWVVGGVTTLAMLLGQSPWKFLTGIGALSAVLLLIFKDSILGLVASFQVSSNNIVRIGDWIEMPKYGADGDVVDISLNTVKVQNWDKTVSTIPTYALIADPVKNWRGMSESGGRRIKRAINIDMNTVTFCTDEMLDRYEKFEHLAETIKQRRQEVNDFNSGRDVDPEPLINGRRLTNLGTFRAYVIGYLGNHPMIRDDMTFLVRQLAPTDRGLPIEIYVFSRDQVWANYESIQADIFDHIIASIPEFDLAVFQSPSGRDFRGLAG